MALRCFFIECEKLRVASADFYWLQNIAVLQPYRRIFLPAAIWPFLRKRYIEEMANYKAQMARGISSWKILGVPLVDGPLTFMIFYAFQN